jgi:DNA-binding NtrC family response regulator
LRKFAPDLPVAIVSGTLSPQIRQSYEKQGIEAIYAKPVDPRKLRDQIPALLNRKTSKAQETSGAPGQAAAPFMVLGASDAALEKPVFAGGSAQVRKLVSDFGRIRDFRVAATISGGPGAAFVDVAVALAEEKDAVLLACAATDVGVEHLTKLFAPALLHTRPVLLIVLNAEKLTAGQQELLEDFLGGGGELAAFNGRAKIILCAETSLTTLADAGEFNEMLLMRAGAMKMVLPKLLSRPDDLGHIARAVLRRVGAAGCKFTPAAQLWLESAPWPGDYLQLHRTVEIARKSRPTASELDVPDLEKALGLEAIWVVPLYHDMLRQSLGVS